MGEWPRRRISAEAVAQHGNLFTLAQQDQGPKGLCIMQKNQRIVFAQKPSQWPTWNQALGWPAKPSSALAVAQSDLPTPIVSLVLHQTATQLGQTRQRCCHSWGAHGLCKTSSVRPRNSSSKCALFLSLLNKPVTDSAWSKQLNSALAPRKFWQQHGRKQVTLKV